MTAVLGSWSQRPGLHSETLSGKRGGEEKMECRERGRKEERKDTGDVFSKEGGYAEGRREPAIERQRG